MLGKPSYFREKNFFKISENKNLSKIISNTVCIVYPYFFARPWYNHFDCWFKKLCP